MNLTDSLEGILPSSPEHNIEHFTSDLCMQQGRNLSNDLLKLVYEHEVSNIKNNNKWLNGFLILEALV